MMKHFLDQLPDDPFYMLFVALAGAFIVCVFLMWFFPVLQKTCTLTFDDGRVIEERDCDMRAGVTSCKGVKYMGVKELRCK